MQELMAAGMYCSDGNMESHSESAMLSVKCGDAGELCITVPSMSMRRKMTLL